MAYEKNGIQYPSVTTITGMLDKPALLGWAARMAVEYIEENIDAVKDPIDVHRGEDILNQAKTAYNIKKDAAADAGTRCHKAIEAYIGGLDYQSILGDCEEANTGFLAFLEWESTNHVEWLESEVEVVSMTHGYAGRFDAVARVNDIRYLIDFKTSKGIYEEMSYQLCAYMQAYNENLEEGQEPIDRIAILHLDKLTGEPTFKPIIKNVQRYTMLFNVLTEAYYLMKNRRLKNNPFAIAVKEIGQPLKDLSSDAPF